MLSEFKASYKKHYTLETASIVNYFYPFTVIYVLVPGYLMFIASHQVKKELFYKKVT